MPKLEYIVFTEIDARWVYLPYEDALVITAKIDNSMIYRVLIDSGSAINILYWNGYKRLG